MQELQIIYPDWISEILNYLPVDDLVINDYTSSISKSIAVNYNNGEYHFCYFATHILFMTYIYTTVWKISEIHRNRYMDSFIFARPYNGCKVDFSNIESVFDFSYIPEKEVFKFLNLIDVDNSFIVQLSKLVKRRNDLAHASGKVVLETKEKFDSEVNTLLSILTKINQKMILTIRCHNERILLAYIKGDFIAEYDNVKDIIKYELIELFSMSLKELEICKEMGISKYSDRENYSFSSLELEKIKEFHKEVGGYYKDLTGEETS